MDNQVITDNNVIIDNQMMTDNNSIIDNQMMTDNNVMTDNNSPGSDYTNSHPNNSMNTCSYHPVKF